jgi:hypothetical protein
MPPATIKGEATMKSRRRAGSLHLVLMAVVSTIWWIAHSQASAEPDVQATDVTSQALNPATVSVQPSMQTVGVGERFSITVGIADLAAPLSAFQFDLGYDPAVVGLAGVEDGGFLRSTGRNAVCPQPISPAGGLLRFACAAAGEATGPTGSGSLAILTFTALDVGTSTLALSAPQVAGAGTPPLAMGVTVQEGEVRVSAAGQPVYLPMVVRGALDGGRTLSPSPAVALGDVQPGRGGIDAQVAYPLTVTNAGNGTDTFGLSVAGASWESVLSSQTSGPLPPAGQYSFTLTVRIPNVPAGSQDVVTVTAVSGLDPGISASTQITTTVTGPDYEIYLPLIDRDS